MINNEPKIKVHTAATNLKKIKIQRYVGDATIRIQHPKELNIIYDIFDKYGPSTAKINPEKAEIFK